MLSIRGVGLQENHMEERLMVVAEGDDSIANSVGTVVCGYLLFPAAPLLQANDATFELPVG